jgi:hypothetical protein
MWLFQKFQYSIRSGLSKDRKAWDFKGSGAASGIYKK